MWIIKLNIFWSIVVISKLNIIYAHFTCVCELIMNGLIIHKPQCVLVVEHRIYFTETKNIKRAFPQYLITILFDNYFLHQNYIESYWMFQVLNSFRMNACAFPMHVCFRCCSSSRNRSVNCFLAKNILHMLCVRICVNFYDM